MDLFARTSGIRLTLVVLLLLLGIGSLVYNNYLVKKLLNQERISIELWAKAIEFNAMPVHQQASSRLLMLANTLQELENVPDSLVQEVLEIENLRSSTDFVTNEIILNESRDFEIPAVLVDSNDNPLKSINNTIDENGEVKVTVEYGFKNIPESKIDTPEKRAEMVKKLKRENPGIPIVIGEGDAQIRQYVYYGESATVRLLRYFPYIQMAILALLLGVGFTTYQSLARAEQSNLWVGMAKEAAHQLGTPISSLLGWVHLFKEEYANDAEAIKLISEIEKDVERLGGVAERFGKIGSKPELSEMSIEPVLEGVITYLERRLPQLKKVVEVQKNLEAKTLVNINPELFQWAVENLVKNAMDALKSTKNKPIISITSAERDNQVIIDVKDTGIGLDPKHAKDIFRPGYSTKKRGWGLGLSLTKRIVEEYHQGKVFVHHSELGVGTTMRIVLPKNKKKA